MSDQRHTVDHERSIHFLTFSVYRRRRLFTLDTPNRIFLGTFNEQLKTFAAKCIGFVMMPDHVHLLIWLPQAGQLSLFVHELKRISSFRIRRWYDQFASNYFREFGQGVRFWQTKFHDFPIYERAKIEEKLEYMHVNPVRASLVSRVLDWRWSSARWYEQRKSVGVRIEWVEVD
jgi:putative transposase